MIGRRYPVQLDRLLVARHIRRSLSPRRIENPANGGRTVYHISQILKNAENRSLLNAPPVPTRNSRVLSPPGSDWSTSGRGPPILESGRSLDSGLTMEFRGRRRSQSPGLRLWPFSTPMDHGATCVTRRKLRPLAPSGVVTATPVFEEYPSMPEASPRSSRQSDGRQSESSETDAQPLARPCPWS